MVIDIVDSLLDKLKVEMLITLEKVSADLSDVFEFDDTHSLEEVQNNLLSVSNVLKMIKEDKAVKLCSVIYSKLDSYNYLTDLDKSNVASSIISLLEYTKSLPNKKDSFLDSSIEKLVSEAGVYSEKEKLALSKIKEIVCQKKLREDEDITWQLVYKASKSYKKIVKTNALYNFIWVGEQISISILKKADAGIGLNKSSYLKAFVDFSKLISEQGESQQTLDVIKGKYELLLSSFSDENGSKQNYNPPEVELPINSNNFVMK